VKVSVPLDCGFTA